MSTTRAFTLRDLIATLCILATLAVLLATGVSRGRADSRKQKDGAQLRALHQGFITAFNCGGDNYPLPSRMDRGNYVISTGGTAKDTTSNIFSMLIFNGTIKPELLVSPVETNPHIVVCRTYQFDRPAAAAEPDRASWDPALSAALDGSKPGNISYAHLQPAGKRMPRWSNSFCSTESVLSNRGPEVTSTTPNPDDPVTPALALPTSNTLRFYGAKTWSGWAAFNDNHVEFRSDYLASGRTFKPESPLYLNREGKKLPDIFCYDEPDDPKAANDFLGIFLKAGDTPADFKAAWD